MEKYEIHNREKMLKAMAVCAGPGCGVQCPYHGKGVGTKTCRTLLLEDAMAALAKDKNDLDDLEAAANTYRDERDKLREGWHDLCDERDKLAAEVDDLETANNTIRAERDALRDGLDNLGKAYENLCTVRDGLNAENNALHDEIDALVRKIGKQEEKTDRPSVFKELPEGIARLIGQAKYQEGRADALAEIVERCSFGGGGRHD